jgi:hypothetical protein
MPSPITINLLLSTSDLFPPFAHWRLSILARLIPRFGVLVYPPNQFCSQSEKRDRLPRRKGDNVRGSHNNDEYIQFS